MPADKKAKNRILKQVVNSYNQIAAEFSLTRNHSWKEFELLQNYLFPNIKILDIGCGNGRLIDYLKNKNLKFEYLGVDNAEEFIKIAKEKHPTNNFKIGNLLELPSGNQEFDLIAAIASFHHLPTKKLRLKSLQEINRTLKKDGLLYLTVWNLFQKKYKKNRLIALIKAVLTFGFCKARDLNIPWGKAKIPRYYYAFKDQEVKDLILRSGFVIIEETKGNNFVYLCKKIK